MNRQDQIDHALKSERKRAKEQLADDINKTRQVLLTPYKEAMVFEGILSERAGRALDCIGFVTCTVHLNGRTFTLAVDEQ